MSQILCLQEPDVPHPQQIRHEELGCITAPTLVAWTSHDPSGPAHAREHIAGQIPGARFELIDWAGHWPRWEQPDTFKGRPRLSRSGVDRGEPVHRLDQVVRPAQSWLKPRMAGRRQALIDVVAEEVH